jgi:hypothetical protein
MQQYTIGDMSKAVWCSHSSRRAGELVLIMVCKTALCTHHTHVRTYAFFYGAAVVDFYTIILKCFV